MYDSSRRTCYVQGESSVCLSFLLWRIPAYDILNFAIIHIQEAAEAPEKWESNAKHGHRPQVLQYLNMHVVCKYVCMKEIDVMNGVPF